MPCMVMIGVSSITLCWSALTICSTLCSCNVAGIGGGGVRMSLMCDCRSISKCQPLVVVAAMLSSAANFLVRARKC
jgi:hypothetical protein